MGNINAKDSSLLEDASAENIDDDDDAVVAIDDAALNDRDLEQNNNDDDDDNDSNISKLLAKQEFAEMCEEFLQQRPSSAQPNGATSGASIAAVQSNGTGDDISLLVDGGVEEGDENYERLEDEQNSSLLNLRDDPTEFEDDYYARFSSGTSSFEALEDAALEFSQSHEKDIYFVRRHRYRKSMFVVARESTALIAYLRHIARLELDCRRRVDIMNTATLPADATEEQVANYVPGILARVASEVLHEPPQFVARTENGSSVRVFPTDSGEPKLGRPDGIVLPLSAAPLFIADKHDVDYVERVEAARRMQAVSISGNSENTLKAIDNRVVNGHLQQFRVVGDRVPFGEPPSPGWDGMSPVQDAENDIWWVVNMHYYMIWRAFEQSCEGNGNFLGTLNTQLQMRGPDTYFFPVKMQAATPYSSRQEHAVLSRVLSEYRQTLVAESEIDNITAQIRNLVEVCANTLDESTMRAARTSMSSTSQASRQALKELESVYATLQSLNTKLATLDAARSRRSYVCQ